jgi:hypothetical protein
MCYGMQMLLFLEVEKLVVPAIPDMVNTWTRSFSFRLLEPPLKEEIKNTSLVIFAESTLLEKTIYKAQLPDKQGTIMLLIKEQSLLLKQKITNTISGTNRMRKKISNLV